MAGLQGRWASYPRETPLARILLSHNYHLALDPREAALGRPYPPLQTLVAGARLRERGHEVHLDDRSFAPDERGFAGVLDRVRPDTLALIGDDHAVPMKQCLGGIRRAGLAMLAEAARREIPSLVSGPDVSDHPEVYLQAGARAAVSGEVQEVLTEWLEGRSGIVGLHGERGAGGRRAPMADLDALPTPAWDLLDAAPYREAWRRSTGAWELPLSTARGCPYRCNWCAKPTWGRSYAVRSAERVAADLFALQDRLAPDRLWMTDDIFALRKRWLTDFRRALDRGRGGRPVLPYRCLSRADLLGEPEVSRELFATGCREVWLGAESGSDAVLASMDKETSVAEIERATRNLRAAGITVGFFLQLGYPGEGLAEVRTTVDLVRRLRPDHIGVSVSYPLPGTAFYERVEGGLRAASWEASMDNRPLFEAPFEQPFYDAAKRVIQHQHAVGLASSAWRRLPVEPRRAGRQLIGAALHGLALPLARARMERRARPNPRAVVLPLE